ncbi:MAG: ATP-binding cassette domain-containing protein [Clostridia bacterium]|nr:ATP-binding cassette domain-containing protein [Clostridia bacterium]
MIEVNSLTKKYGSNCAVNDVSFKINEGEIVGFLGPNGAGKSTTMNMITGYLSSTSGSIIVNGHDVLTDPISVKKNIGYLPELPPLYMDMTVKGYLDFVFNLKQVPYNRKEHIGKICELVKIEHVYNRLIKNLSKGYKQRVGVAQALIGSPPILILDEPTVGLDPKQIIEIRDLIVSLGKSHTIILSSHILPEVQQVCNRILVINKGKLVADASAENLGKSFKGDERFTIRVAGPKEEVGRLLAKVANVEKVIEEGEKESGSCDFLVVPTEGCDVRREVFNRLADRRWPILNLDGGVMTLEDIFLKLTSEAAMQ